MNLLYYIVISIILISVIIYLILKSKYRLSKDEKIKFQNTLSKIISGHDARYVIIHLDSLLDKILNKLGYKGSLGEKMKKYGTQFLNENNIWMAHKTRNILVHEIDYNLPSEKFNKVKKYFVREINNIIGF